MAKDNFQDFLYRVENFVDEFAIAALSFGAIFVAVYTLVFSAQDVGFISFGKIIEPWITMLALMLIARELWLMNMQKQQEGE